MLSDFCTHHVVLAVATDDVDFAVFNHLASAWSEGVDVGYASSDTFFNSAVGRVAVEGNIGAFSSCRSFSRDDLEIFGAGLIGDVSHIHRSHFSSELHIVLASGVFEPVELVPNPVTVSFFKHACEVDVLSC